MPDFPIKYSNSRQSAKALQNLIEKIPLSQRRTRQGEGNPKGKLPDSSYVERLLFPTNYFFQVSYFLPVNYFFPVNYFLLLNYFFPISIFFLRKSTAISRRLKSAEKAQRSRQWLHAPYPLPPDKKEKKRVYGKRRRQIPKTKALRCNPHGHPD